jgi:hypothetical protein
VERVAQTRFEVGSGGSTCIRGGFAIDAAFRQLWADEDWVLATGSDDEPPLEAGSQDSIETKAETTGL